jgi:[ribosomal protein S5]-alanine N-acetyltransferase
VDRTFEIPALAGELIALRPISPAELILVNQWVQESDILTMTCAPPVLQTPEEIVERRKEREPSATQATLAIVLRGTGTLAGLVRYFDLNFRNRSVEIGYVVAPSARGKGVAREAVSILLGYLFDGLGMNKVFAQTASFNAASLRLLGSLGFKKDGVLREHHLYQGKLYDDYIYSILARERQTREKS